MNSPDFAYSVDNWQHSQSSRDNRLKVQLVKLYIIYRGVILNEVVWDEVGGGRH